MGRIWRIYNDLPWLLRPLSSTHYTCMQYWIHINSLNCFSQSMYYGLEIRLHIHVRNALSKSWTKITYVIVDLMQKGSICLIIQLRLEPLRFHPSILSTNLMTLAWKQHTYIVVTSQIYPLGWIANTLCPQSAMLRLFHCSEFCPQFILTSVVFVLAWESLSVSYKYKHFCQFNDWRVRVSSI